MGGVGIQSRSLTLALVAAASFVSAWALAGTGGPALLLAVVFTAPLVLGPSGFAGAFAGVLAAALAGDMSLVAAVLASAVATVPAAAGAACLRLEVILPGARGSAVRAIGVTLAVAASAAIAFVIQEGLPFWPDLLPACFGFVVAAALPVVTIRAVRSDAADADRRGFMASILDTLPAVVFMKDARGRYTVVNRRFEAFLGKGREDILGRTDRELFPAELAESFEREDREVLAARRVVELERDIPLNGAQHAFLVSKFPLLGPGGVPHSVGGVASDIDERRRAEHGLRRALSLLEATLEASGEGLLVVDHARHTARHNQRFADMWRLPAEVLATGEDERILDHALGQVVDPEGFVARIRELYARPEDESLDVLHLKDGRIIERYSRPQRLDAEVVGRVWSFRDVTARRQAEEGLRAANETLTAIIEASPVAILTLDRDGKARSWNPAAEGIFGWTAEETLGRVPLFVPEEGREEFRDILDTIVREGRPAYREIVRRRKDGTPVYVQLRSAPLRAASGEISGVVSILMDITAARLAEEELLRHRDHLAELVSERTRALSNTNRELETFCYTVSHDMRAPLRAIDGFSRILIEEAGEHLDEVAMRYLARIRAAVGRMSRLIDDLLQLSRVSRCALRSEHVDLGALAQSVVADLRAGNAARDVEVTIEAALMADGDAALFRSLLQNLFENAWKFSSGLACAHITFGARFEGGERVFFVRDDGVGFDMAYAARLFAPFERLHRSEEFEGTGIGLATVERVVQRHGGRVWAEAAIGHGATFYFTLTTVPSTSR